VKENEIWITIYTDASFCPNSKKSSWAFWAKSNLGKIKNAGMCPAWVTDNNAAELYAVLMALKNIFGKWSRHTNIKGVYIISDNKTVCRSMWKWSKNNKNKTTLRVQNKIKRLSEKENIWIKTKHIPSHRNSFDKETMNSKEGHYLNQVCDKLAYKMLKNYSIPQSE
jgi:ribonuclease HI